MIRAVTCLVIGVLSTTAHAAGRTIAVADFGAVPNDERSDRRQIQNAIDASAPGDTIVFGQGVYDLPAAVQFRTGRTYTGQGDATVLRFTDVEYGVFVEAEARDVTITKLKFQHAGIDLGAGGPRSAYANISIVGNFFDDIPGHAIKCTMPNDRLVIERNKFTNVRGYGCVVLYHMNRGSYSHNTFIDCKHGGHILGPLDDCTFSFNRGVRLHNMGLEIQRSGESVSRNMTVEGNVFYDWVLPFCSSFGMSIMAEGGLNTRIANNYLRASRIGPWNPNLEGQGERFGPGIEAGFETGVVEGNIIGGPFCHFVTTSGVDMLVRNNKFYGQPVWKKPIGRWPSIHGLGTFIDENNVHEEDFSKMPPPPEAAR